MDITRHWRLKDQRYGLTGSVCTNCGHRSFAPRPVCQMCSSSLDEAYDFTSKPRRTSMAAMIEPAQK